MGMNAKTKQAVEDFENALTLHVSPRKRAIIRERMMAIVESKRGAVPKGGNDCIMTPDSLAIAIVRHFRPIGLMCDPCSGEGAFLRAFYDSKLSFTSYEIKNGHDFLEEMPAGRFDWIITNPPWSKFLSFLKKSLDCAPDIVFLAYANAWHVKARINAMERSGFYFREYAKVANPLKPWPQMGLQLAAVHISRKKGLCKHTTIDWKP